MIRLLILFVLFALMPISAAWSEDNNSVPAGTGIGQLPAEKEVTRMGNSEFLAEYIPLDKGNIWTYEMIDPGREKEHTQKIVSESEGWSVYDNFFGVPGASFRIAPGGELLVTKKGQVSTFYGEGAAVSYADSVDTPSGIYKDVMVVTTDDDKSLWFRDVYIKGVGLVFHEHKSPKGHSIYTLKKATVRGKEYPAE